MPRKPCALRSTGTTAGWHRNRRHLHQHQVNTSPARGLIIHSSGQWAHLLRTSMPTESRKRLARWTNHTPEHLTNHGLTPVENPNYTTTIRGRQRLCSTNQRVAGFDIFQSGNLRARLHFAPISRKCITRSHAPILLSLLLCTNSGTPSAFVKFVKDGIVNSLIIKEQREGTLLRRQVPHDYSLHSQRKSVPEAGSRKTQRLSDGPCKVATAQRVRKFHSRILSERRLPLARQAAPAASGKTTNEKTTLPAENSATWHRLATSQDDRAVSVPLAENGLRRSGRHSRLCLGIRMATDGA
jgi:hypothetical protein